MSKLRTARRRTSKPRTNREEILHRAVVQFLRTALPETATFNHPHNEGLRSKADAGRAKAMGQQPGEPDIQIVYKEKGIGRFLAIELKAPAVRCPQTGKILSPAGTVTDRQSDRHKLYSSLGCPVAVCYSIEDVEDFLASVGIRLRARTRIGGKHGTADAEVKTAP